MKAKRRKKSAKPSAKQKDICNADPDSAELSAAAEAPSKRAPQATATRAGTRKRRHRESEPSDAAAPEVLVAKTAPAAPQPESRWSRRRSSARGASATAPCRRSSSDERKVAREAPEGSRQGSEADADPDASPSRPQPRVRRSGSSAGPSASNQSLSRASSISYLSSCPAPSASSSQPSQPAPVSSSAPPSEFLRDTTGEATVGEWRVEYASVTTPGGRYGGLNQDRHFVLLDTSSGSLFFVVADGHGPSGHMAAETACRSFRSSLGASPIASVPAREAEGTLRSLFRAAHERVLELYGSPGALKQTHVLFTAGAEAARFELRAALPGGGLAYVNTTNAGDVRSVEFGTTATIVALRPDGALVSANAGDSVAVLGGRRRGALAPAGRVSEMHHSSNPRERGRVTKRGAGMTWRDPYLYPPPDSPGPRVAGIALTRSLGHRSLCQHGITWEPFCASRTLSKPGGGRDSGGGPGYALIVASDGLWEQLSDEEALSLLDGCSSAREGAALLAAAAAAKYGVEDRVDNISVICALLWPAAGGEASRSEGRR
eukprot:tig00020903_g15122.t1